jgi:hypothetical protein
MSVRPWTKFEDDILAGGFRAGWSENVFLEALPDRTWRSIQTRLARKGIRPKRINLGGTGTRMVEPAGMDGEIQKLCAYITDDRYIAGYLGTPLDRVRRVRHVIAKEKPRQRPVPDDSQPLGLNRDISIATETREASEALLRRMVWLYEREAAAAGTTPEIAMLACLFGRDAANRFTTQKENACAR